MARVTIEDCLEQIENKFELIHATKLRARQLMAGDDAIVQSKNREIVTALREIATGAISIKEQAVRTATDLDDEDLSMLN